jgi:hypothetical protein
MNLPRVILRLSERGTGWRVEVIDWQTDDLVSTHDVDAVEVGSNGSTQRVPVVPIDRRPSIVGPHAELCAGNVSELEGLLERIATDRTGSNDVTKYGRWLFECVVAPAWVSVRALPSVMAARGVELALEWPISTTDLHGLVWEAMHDGTAALAGHRELLVAVTRLVPTVTDPPTSITRLPRVLFAVGASLTDEVIRPGAMFMGLLRSFEANGQCRSHVTQDATVADLAEECAKLSPDVVHLVAHGRLGEDGGGMLIMGENSPEGGPVDAGAVATALASGESMPLAVVVSACKSGVTDGGAAAPFAADLVSRGIPIVSAMAGDVSEQACRLYTRRFVQAMHAGEPVVEAAAKGRRAALLHTQTPSEQLDWAMPALFLSASVPPTFRAIDPTATTSLINLAGDLDLPQQPLFIGRRDIMELAESVFAAAPGTRLGFVGVVREGSLHGLGGTRLLREIGFTALRSGHVPLLLGPYSEVNKPASLRGVVVEILQRALKVARLRKIPPPPLATMGVDRDFAADAVAYASNVATLDLDDAHTLALETLFRFGQGSAVLDPTLVKNRLGRDVAALAQAVGTSGEPFGDHTRVLVLCDEVHSWIGGLDPLLAMVDANGLGTSDHPVPVIVTASLIEHTGATVRSFRDARSGKTAFVFPELTALAPKEAALGFQWVLLHPWRRDRDEMYRSVYAPARNTSSDQVGQLLAILKGVPAEVDEMLYVVAAAAHAMSRFIAEDDDRAYDEYVGKYG